MGYAVFLVCLVLEFCPVDGWDWDFGLMWCLVLFVLLVQVALDVTRVQGRRSQEQEEEPR